MDVQAPAHALKATILPSSLTCLKYQGFYQLQTEDVVKVNQSHLYYFHLHYCKYPQCAMTMLQVYL